MSDLAKYSVTQSIARFLCDSCTSCAHDRPSAKCDQQLVLIPQRNSSSSHSMSTLRTEKWLLGSAVARNDRWMNFKNSTKTPSPSRQRKHRRIRRFNPPSAHEVVYWTLTVLERESDAAGQSRRRNAAHHAAIIAAIIHCANAEPMTYRYMTHISVFRKQEAPKRPRDILPVKN